MTIVTNAKTYDWPTWLIGILRSFISGGAGAVAGFAGPMITDAKDFNFSSGLGHTLESMATGFLIAGIVHLAMFLQTHSAPDQVAVAPAKFPGVDLSGQNKDGEQK